VWLERGMGHAETATTAELMERIGAWVRGGGVARRLGRWRP
jgi:hypothetical protein